jgi:ATP-dependent Lon protease
MAVITMDSPPGFAHDLAPALTALPIFPLPKTVLFPGAILPLHIFEPRYRAMIRDCLEQHKALAVALIREQAERDAHDQPAIEAIAGVGLIVNHVKLADGRYDILVHGRARVRLEELPFVPPYRRARATVLRPGAGEPSPHDVVALLSSAAAFATDMRKRDPTFEFALPPHSQPAAAADLAAHHLVVDARERQSLLETLDVAERVHKTTHALALQHAALRRRSGGASN